MEADNVRMDLELSSNEDGEDSDEHQRVRKKRKKKSVQKEKVQDISETVADFVDEESGNSLDNKRQRIVVEECLATSYQRMSDGENNEEL